MHVNTENKKSFSQTYNKDDAVILSLVLNKDDNTPKYYNDKNISLVQTCSLKQGEIKFGDRATHAAC